MIIGDVCFCSVPLWLLLVEAESEFCVNEEFFPVTPCVITLPKIERNYVADFLVQML